MSIVPESSGGGNILNPPVSLKIKQSPIRKNHFFTYFWKIVPNFDMIVDELKKFAYKGKVQTEICPSTGRQHLQGMIWCKSKHRDTEFKLLKGACFLPLKDVDDVSNYCNKEETHDGVFRASWGVIQPFVEEIADLYPWQTDIVNLLKVNPDKRSLHWYWEPDGAAGKTTFQKYLFTHYKDVVVLSGKAADMKNGIVSYIEANKTTPRIVLVNIPRSSLGFVSYTGLEEIKDMFFFSGKYEGGMVCGPSPYVLIFANEEPDYKKMSSDRFVVKRIV